jgi:type II secretory pathway component GspD/PulD (secretin)
MSFFVVFCNIGQIKRGSEMLMRIGLIMICVLGSGCIITEKSVEKRTSSGSQYNKSENEKWEWKVKEGKANEFDYKGIDVDIQFEQVELKDVVSLLLGIIKENFVVVGDMSGSVDIEIKGKYKRKEIIKMTRTIVNSKGYELVKDGILYRIYNIEDSEDISIKILPDDTNNIYIYHLQYETSGNVVALLNDVFSELEITEHKNVNMIVIKSSMYDYKKVRDVIKKIDKRPKQVLVEFTIMEVALTNGLKYGVEYFIRKNLDRGGNVSLLPSGVISGGGNVIGDGIKAFTFHRDFDSFITLLRSESKVEILSKPNVLVQDGKRSTIKIGRVEPIKKGTTVSANGLASENIEYRDVGVILKVKVDIEENNIVKLELSLEISDIVSPLVNPLIDSPSFTNKVIQISTLVNDGQKIYIGGLMETVNDKKVKKIPLLGDIPYLGKLFRSEVSVKTKTELILLLSVDVLNKESDFDRQKSKYIRKA